MLHSHKHNPNHFQMNNEEKETVSQLSLWSHWSVVMEAEARLESHWRSKINYKVNCTRNLLEEAVTWGLQAGKDGPSEEVNKLKGRGMFIPSEA